MDQLPQQTGYLPNPHDPRDVWSDEVLAGSTQAIPAYYLIPSIPFEAQGSYPFCTSFATCKLLQEAIKKAGGSQTLFSQPYQFFHSNGQMWGSTFRDNLNTAVNLGLIPWSDLPMPDSLWDLNGYDSLKEKSGTVTPSSQQKALGYVRINPNTDDMKKAILEYGPILTGVAASGTYWADGSERPPGSPVNHCVLIVGWREDGCWAIHDSLQPLANFDGYHYLAKDYEFDSCYALAPLPTNWRDLRDQARAAPPTNANYYGKHRDLAAEQSFATQMLATFQKFNNQSVTDAAGRFWEMYIRAGVYGGYSLTDLVNDCYNWRRTGQHVFNFDNSRTHS